MQVTVTAEFDAISLAKSRDAKVVTGSESQQLAESIWSMTDLFNVGFVERGTVRNDFAELLGKMAAEPPHGKLTELRILHSIMTTYRDFLMQLQVVRTTDIMRRLDIYTIVVTLNTMQRIAIEAEVDGVALTRSYRQIDMIDSPNVEGNVAKLDEVTQAPKRRMRLRVQSND